VAFQGTALEDSSKAPWLVKEMQARKDGANRRPDCSGEKLRVVRYRIREWDLPRAGEGTK